MSESTNFIDSEDVLKSQLSYAERKKIVQGSERKFGITGTYTGTTEQNNDLIDALNKNNLLKISWEREVAKIQNSTRGQINDVRNSLESNATFRNVANGMGARTTDTQINSAHARVMESQDTKRDFLAVNSRLMTALQKDFEGNWIRGGLLGGITKLVQALGNKKSEVSQLIDELNADGGNRGDRLKSALEGQAKSLKRLPQSIIKTLGSPIGTLNDKEVTEKITGVNMSTAGAIKGIIETAAMSALSTAISGNPSLYLGSLRVPLVSIQNIPNLDKNEVSQAITGKNYADIMDTASTDLDRFGDLNSKKRNVGKARDVLASLNQTNEVSGKGVSESVKRGSTIGNLFNTNTRNKLASPDTSRNEKVQLLRGEVSRLENVLGKWDRWRPLDANRQVALSEAKQMLEDLGDTQRIDNQVQTSTLNDNKSIAVARLLNGARNFTEFQQRYSGSYNPDIDSEIADYYRGNTDAIRGLTSNLGGMAIAYQKGDTTLRNYLNKNNTNRPSRETDIYNSKGKYFDGESIQVNASNIADYVDTSFVKSKNTPSPTRLADLYTRNLKTWGRGGINVTSSDIVNGLRNARVETRKTYNSSIDMAHLPNKTWTGRQFVFETPAFITIVDKTGRDYTVKSTMTLGIKPNCLNLQPISMRLEGENTEYDISNGTSHVPFRIPLSISGKKGSQESRSPSRKATNTRENTPNTPNVPQKQPGFFKRLFGSRTNNSGPKQTGPLSGRSVNGTAYENSPGAGTVTGGINSGSNGGY